MLLLASAQGIFLAILIFRKQRRIAANHFLGLLILCFSLILLMLVPGSLKYDSAYHDLMVLLPGLPLLIGALHYLYTRQLTSPRRRFRGKDWLHFLPPLFWVALFSVDVLLRAFDMSRLTGHAAFQGSDRLFMLFNWLVLATGFAYMTAALFLLKKHDRKIRDIYSSLDKVKLSWLRNMTFFITAAFPVFLLENLFVPGGQIPGNIFTPAFVLATLAVYSLGYLGLIKSDVLSGMEETIDTREAAGPKYVKAGLSEARALDILERLLRHMETEKPYRRSDLTLGHLAKELSVSPLNLTEVIHTRLQQNFFDFVNHYRVEEVKKDLANPGNRNFKLLAVALDAGFNSRSSFNAIFKKHTGVPPSVYQKNQLKEIAGTPGA